MIRAYNVNNFYGQANITGICNALRLCGINSANKFQPVTSRDLQVIRLSLRFWNL